MSITTKLVIPTNSKVKVTKPEREILDFIGDGTKDMRGKCVKLNERDHYVFGVCYRVFSDQSDGNFDHVEVELLPCYLPQALI